MTEAKYDVSFASIPAEIGAAAKRQALALNSVSPLAINDMLIAQRRLGEAVLGLWLAGKLGEAGLGELIPKCTDPKLVKHRTKSIGGDKHTLPMFKE